jgi:hypothetical protein
VNGLELISICSNVGRSSRRVLRATRQGGPRAVCVVVSQFAKVEIQGCESRFTGLGAGRVCG